MTVATADRWFRVDHSDGTITSMDMDGVIRAACSAFKYPEQAIKTGRFRTNFAIYATRDLLASDEIQGYDVDGEVRA